MTEKIRILLTNMKRDNFADKDLQKIAEVLNDTGEEI
jgi:hypothetical protein